MTPRPLNRAIRRTLLRLGNLDALTDDQLVERFVAAQDETAFEELVRRHGPMVHGICRRILGPVPDADDAFQAVFIVLLRRVSSPARPKSIGGWLHGVACRIAQTARNRSVHRLAREKSMEAAAPAGLAQSGSPTEAAGQDLRPILDEELGRLPERYRGPIVLCYLEGRSVDQAAAELGLARGTVASRMSRGRDLLRKRLTKRGLALSAAALTAQLESTATAAVSLATVQTLIPAGLAHGAGVREGAAILAKGALQGMFWSKLRWGGILLACLVMLGTATVKWTATTNKPAGNAKGSTERGDDFYVRWRFDNGPPKDIQKLGGNWEWANGAGKQPGAMLIPDASLLLPTRIPKRPFVLSVKLAGFMKPESETKVGAAYAENNVRGGWMAKRRVRWTCTQPVYIYFADRWALTNRGTVNGGRQFIVAEEYRVPYPSQRIGLRIKNLAIVEIELRSLRPEEIPMELRHAEQTVKTMKFSISVGEQPLSSVK